MKSTSHWTTAVLAALTILPVAAKDDQGPPRGHRPPPSPVIQTLDADKDHKISAEEIKAASTALLTLDTDGDGALSKEEMKPKRPEGAPEGKEEGPPPAEDDKNKEDRPKPPKNPVIEALDTDGDGTLSAEEIAKAAESLAKLDKDGDGEISEKEFRPEPPKDSERKEGKDSKEGKEDRGGRGGRPPRGR